MDGLFLTILAVSGACTLVLAPLLLLSRAIRHRYAARTMYVLWLLLALRLLIPVQLTLPEPAVTVEPPAYTVELPARRADPLPATGPAGDTGAWGMGGAAVYPASGGEAELPAAVGPVKIDLMAVLGALWLMGAALVLLWQGLSYLLARRRLLRGAPPAGAEAQALLEDLRRGLGIRRRVALRRYGAVKSPVMLGLFRSVIVLPEEAARAGELGLVLRHELLHLKYWDVAYKAVMLLCCAVHWFNPFVWWMAREAGRNVELCCDDRVLRGVGREERRRYGELLLSTAVGGSSPALSTRFGSGKKQLKDRLSNLFKRKRNSALLVCAVLLLALALGGLVACESGGEEAGTGEPLNAFEAVMALEDSIQYDQNENKISFRLPEGYAPTADWDIRAEYQLGGSEALHSMQYLEELNAAHSWEVGTTYSFPLSEDYARLLLTFALPDEDGEGGRRERTVDLLGIAKGVSALYVNDTYGFTLQLPEDWAGKYTVTESEGQVEFFQKRHGNNSGKFFAINVENAAEFRAMFEGMTDAEIEEDWATPMRILGEGGGYIFYIGYVSDVNVDLSNEDIRAEYKAMDAGARSLSPADFTYTRTTQPADDMPVPLPEYDPTDLEQSISAAILRQQDWSSLNVLKTEAHRTLKVEEEGGRTTAYLMAIYLGFSGDTNGFTQQQGGQSPVVLTFERDASGVYNLTDYWEPLDGEGYWDSVRGKFPADIPDEALDTQAGGVSVQSCYAQAIRYWNVDVGPIVEGLLETIMPSPAASSNPGDYIDDHPWEYRELCNYGEYAVDYCLRQLRGGGQTGLKGAIMELFCQDMQGLGGSDDSSVSQELLDAFFLDWGDYGVISSVRQGDRCVILAREQPDEVVGYYAPKAFIMKQSGGTWETARWLDCDPALSPGFSVSVLQGEGITVVFGDLGDHFMLPPDVRTRVDFDTVDVAVQYPGGASTDTYRSDSGAYLFVFDGEVDVTDVSFSVDGAVVTSYTGVYSAPPVPESGMTPADLLG